MNKDFAKHFAKRDVEAIYKQAKQRSKIIKMQIDSKVKCYFCDKEDGHEKDCPAFIICDIINNGSVAESGLSP